MVETAGHTAAPQETLSAAYRRARRTLAAKTGLPEERWDTAAGSRITLEARELSCAEAGIPRGAFYTQPDAPVDSTRLDALLARRMSGEPLAYCLGEWDFCGDTFRTDRRALIPRDDSEATLDLFLMHLPQDAPSLTLFDLCTGSGCLGIEAVRRLRERGCRVRMLLADKSADALSLAEENVRRFGLEDCIRVCEADLFALQTLDPTAAFGAMDGFGAFDGFDGCICNPPYIDREELAELDREVLAFEPVSALYGGEDGLDFYRAGVEQIPPLLKTGGVLTFEVGYAQAGAVAALFLVSGFEDIRFENDLQKVPRAVSAKKCG